MQKVIKAKGLVDVVKEKIIQDPIVIIDVDKITAAGTQEETPLPQGPHEVFDFPGKYILPGLINSHAHMTMIADGRPNPVWYQESNEMFFLAAGRNARFALMSGVTTIRDCGGRNGVMFAMRRGIEMGITEGPRLVLSGRPLTATGGHAYHDHVEVDGPDEMKKAVRQLFKEGAGFRVTNGDRRNNMRSRLKEYLDLLGKKKEVVRISKEVDPRFEASAIIKKIQQGINKAVIFEKIKGYHLPLVSNILGTYKRVAMILGCEVDEINSTWNRKEKDMELFSPISGQQEPDEYVESAIHEIPSLIYCEKDAGPYITAGMALARDPDTGTYNLSFHRLQVVDDSKLRFRITPGNHLETLFQKAEKRGQPLEMAILIGGHPAFMLAAASRLPLDQDELKLAGAFLGHPVKLRQCKKINLEVPTGIDFVIEGALLPNVREEEGPFGDFLGYYVPVLKNLVFEVRCVSRLRDSHVYGILAGSAEQDLLVGVPIAANIYKIVKGAIPSVLDVACMPHIYHSVVKIKPQFLGQARQAAMAALSCDPSQTKICTVVDPDVDIHNPSDVHWAITTRCCPDTGVFIVPNIPSFRRDPFRTHWGKMGIDATMPLSEEAASDFQRTRIPGVENIKLEDYLP